MHSRWSQAPAHSASPADARSVPPRSSDVSCAICKRLGASDAAASSSMSLSARTAARPLAPRTRHHPLQPRVQPPQPTTRSIISAQPKFASTRSQHKPSRCTQHTAEVQRRQLRHPSETRCQRRCPICSDPIVCTHRRPSARPSQAPTRYSPAYNRPSPQHTTSSIHIAGVRKHPRTAQAQPMHAAYC